MPDLRKKILILGGSHFQVPVITYARLAGYHVITCDYLPGNPGHRHAHEYHNISTTDQDRLLTLARRLHVDAILAYASDPAACTAAYVGNKLGLPSNPYESVHILTRKDLYRKFLTEHGFNAPKTWILASEVDFLREPVGVTFPIMVKPVDSSGSKGVSLVTAEDGMRGAVEHALQFSRAGRVLGEQYVAREGAQIGGEAFVYDGRLAFMCLGDQVVDNQCNPYVPAGMMFPSRISADLYAKIASDVQRLLDLLHFSCGGLNLEIMLDRNECLYLMEVGPRTGGNFLPELMRYCAGMDIAKYSVEAALGHRIPGLPRESIAPSCNGSLAYYAIHSRVSGTLRSIHLDTCLRSHVLEVHVFRQPGDRIEIYNGSNCTIGILLLCFEEREQMEAIINGMPNYIRVELEADSDGGGKSYISSIEKKASI